MALFNRLLRPADRDLESRNGDREVEIGTGKTSKWRLRSGNWEVKARKWRLGSGDHQAEITKSRLASRDWQVETSKLSGLLVTNWQSGRLVAPNGWQKTTYYVEHYLVETSD